MCRMCILNLVTVVACSCGIGQCGAVAGTPDSLGGLTNLMELKLL